jgi:putative Ca2+/H+ antiporter (TMEM165/GDT1 family)
LLETIVNSFFLVATSEFGDKTMLLTLVLTARYGRPGAVLAGIFFGALLNHGLAALTGQYASTLIDPVILKWILGLSFIGFGVWILVPEKDGEEEVQTDSARGPFLTTMLTFFVAEMGDKTQLATVALAARYQNILAVLTGTVLAMVTINGLAVLFGHKLTERVPMIWIRRAAAGLFFIFGIAMIVAHSP